MAKSSLEKMKERLKKSSPKISGRANLENMNQIKNFVFGKSKSMGIDDEKKEMAKQNAFNKKYKKNNSTSTKKGKVDVGLSEALKKQKNKKKPLGKSPGALGGKIKNAPKSNSRTMGVTGKLKKNDALNPIARNTKTKVKATAGNTKNFASTMATQKKLIKMGAKIKADGIMGPKTRAAMAKFMKPGALPKSRPTKNSGVSQGSTIAKDRGKTGFGTSAMNTKGSSKPAEKRAKKKYGLSLTELQKKRARRDNRRKMIGST